MEQRVTAEEIRRIRLSLLEEQEAANEEIKRLIEETNSVIFVKLRELQDRCPHERPILKSVYGYPSEFECLDCGASSRRGWNKEDPVDPRGKTDPT